MPASCLPIAATGKTPCTVWPRTVMRGNPRKVNSGRPCVPKSARRTEPSPRNPRFAAHLRCVSAKEGEGSQEGTGNHMVSCPLLSPPPDGGIPAGEHRHPRPPKAANGHAHFERKVASSGAPLYRRKGIPSAEGKEKGTARPAEQALSHAEKNLWNFFKKTLDFIVSIC